MIFDTTIVNKFLKEDNFDEIESHWLFNNIEQGKHLFESPNITSRNDINKILVSILNTLSSFRPFNTNIYTSIYPEWKQITKDINVLLVVGCPNPYDAMVREYDGKQYVIFDLIRLNTYVELGYNVDFMINQLVTHEISHLCLHKKYPVPTSNKYVENLEYLVFDEAFAHVLAFKENIESYDFAEMIEKHYSKSLQQLRSALVESDSKKQSELLVQANSGHYWDKFGSISGKLFLANNIEDLETIYSEGVDNFMCLMGLKI